MKIGSVLKTSLIDFPGEVSSVVFFQGCPWRCEYCHNPELVIPGEMTAPLSVNAVMRDLLNRRSQVPAVTLTGGEPIMQPGLIGWMLQLKQAGFKIKLDTNGHYPKRLLKILQESPPDYIAMDVKTDYKAYNTLVKKRSVHHVADSIGIISRSGILHEFRTTVVEDYHLPSRMLRIFELVPKSSPYYLQGFTPSEKMVGSWQHYAPTSATYLEKVRNMAVAFGLNAFIR